MKKLRSLSPLLISFMLALPPAASAEVRLPGFFGDHMVLQRQAPIPVWGRADPGERITVEQVRSAMDVWLDTADLPPASRRKRFEAELEKQRYYQQRNKQARRSHTKTRIARLTGLGIDITQIKSCLPDTEPP